MNKLVILDLDGTIVDLKDSHFECLNRALEYHNEPPIAYEDHISRFDGLPTFRKLYLLGIHEEKAQHIGELKQKYTLEYIDSHVKTDAPLVNFLHECHAKSYLIAVASNAKHETVLKCLDQLGVSYLIAFVATPDQGYAFKPDPDQYLRLMKRASSCPRNTIIFEDSPQGLRGGWLSGARVVQITKANYPDRISLFHNAINQEIPPFKYNFPDLTVVIPAAGEGKRFKDNGYTKSKPLIDVDGKPMLNRVVDNLAVNANIVAVMRYQDFNAALKIQVMTLSVPTKGAVETCLRACDYISDRPLLTANCDQILEWNSTAFWYACENTNLDGLVVTFTDESRNPKWSFCEIGEDGLVKRVAEKDPISTVANCGLFYWKNGSDFLMYARDMMAKNITVNGEFYVAPIINEAIKAGKKFGTFMVDRMWGLGVPEDLEAYLAYRKGKL